MGFGTKISVLVLLYLAFSGEQISINAKTSSGSCNFPAIFNFGDSNSDTGGAQKYFHTVSWPNGMTVGKVIKRASDGRLIIDFLAKSLGLPYLNASADTDGTSFKYGANFAVGGNKIDPSRSPNPANPTEWDYNLNEQVSRFLAFKSRAIASKDTNMYPNPEAFSESLYTIDIGQNDVNGNFGNRPVSRVLEFFTTEVQRLLNNGAKYLWVHNTSPFGCLPLMVESLEAMGIMDRDKYGCSIKYNGKAQDFNKELKKRIQELRKQYPDAVITLVNMYKAKYNLISHPKGFNNSLKFKRCCGIAGGAFCGHNVTVNSKIMFGDACHNPSDYLSWDGVHWTEAANKLLAKKIMAGSFSQPRVPISQACRKQ